LEIHAKDVLIEVDGFLFVSDYVQEVAYADDVAGRGGRGERLGYAQVDAKEEGGGDKQRQAGHSSIVLRIVGAT
jgi:hypothetical protein